MQEKLRTWEMMRQVDIQDICDTDRHHWTLPHWQINSECYKRFSWCILLMLYNKTTDISLQVVSKHVYLMSTRQIQPTIIPRQDYTKRTAWILSTLSLHEGKQPLLSSLLLMEKVIPTPAGLDWDSFKKQWGCDAQEASHAQIMRAEEGGFSL